MKAVLVSPMPRGLKSSSVLRKTPSLARSCGRHRLKATAGAPHFIKRLMKMAQREELPDLLEMCACFQSELFGDMPMDLEFRLSVDDSPNSAGVAIDAIRCCKLALERGQGAALCPSSPYCFKHPPRQYTDDEAYHWHLSLPHGAKS